MKIGIILNRVNFEEKQIIKSIENKGHKVVQINNQDLILSLKKEKTDIIDKYGELDIIIQRSLSFTRGLYSTAILEMKGYKVINNFNCLRICGDKLLTSLKLEENGIETPYTIVTFTKEASIESIENKIKYPAIIKPIIGSWGRLIAKLDNYNSAEAIIEDREVLGDVYHKIYYLQKYIGPDDRDKNEPTDIRVIQLGDDAIASMGRTSIGNEFRSNIAIGGKASKYNIDLELKNLCKKIQKVIGGDFIGIDLMKTKKGYVCIEVNGTPQFKGISEVNNFNIAEKFVDFILEKYN